MTIQVIDPVDIIKDPNTGPTFNMHNDEESMACQFTADLCVLYIKHRVPEIQELLALMKWGMRHPASIGVAIAKPAMVAWFDSRIDDTTRQSGVKDPAFIEMYTRYGKLLTDYGSDLTQQFFNIKGTIC